MTAPHRSIPTLSFGTYLLRPGDEVEQAVAFALAAGHRVFDTAAVYRNEESVGKVLNASSVPRAELHVTTKLQPCDQKGYDAALAAIRVSLRRLGTDYVDCYLMHWPAVAKARVDDPAVAVSRCETWRGMVEAKRLGLCREVGVCNFQVRHFESLLKAGLPLPDVHQTELHPMCRQDDAVRWCQERHVAVEAYSPLAQFDKRVIGNRAIMRALTVGSRAAADEDAPDSKRDEVQVPTPEQAAEGLLAWSFWRGFTPLARSRSQPHIEFNASVWRRWAAGGAERDRLERVAIELDKVRAPSEIHVCWNSEVVVH